MIKILDSKGKVIWFKNKSLIQNLQPSYFSSIPNGIEVGHGSHSSQLWLRVGITGNFCKKQKHPPPPTKKTWCLRFIPYQLTRSSSSELQALVFQVPQVMLMCSQGGNHRPGCLLRTLAPSWLSACQDYYAGYSSTNGAGVMCLLPVPSPSLVNAVSETVFVLEVIIQNMGGDHPIHLKLLTPSLLG